MNESEDQIIDSSIVTECVIKSCGRPLGQETRDLAIPVCHEHRVCNKCKREVDSSAEVEYCLSRKLAIRHARCLALETPSLDLEVELMNLARLVIYPNPQMSRKLNQQHLETACNLTIDRVSHDMRLLIMEQAQTLAAAISLSLSKNRREIEKQIEERENENFAQASRERKEHETRAPKAAKQRLSKDEETLKNFMGMAEMMGVPPADQKQWALTRMQELAESRKEMLK